MRPFSQPETPHVETADWALAPRRVLWYFSARPKSLFKIPIRFVARHGAAISVEKGFIQASNDLVLKN